MKRNILSVGKKTKKNLFHTKRIRNKWNVPAAFAAGVVFCLLIFLLVKVMPQFNRNEETLIVLTARSETIYQGENLPELSAGAEFADGTETKEKEAWLSKEAGYRVQDLLDDLNEGGDYEVECDADGSEAGEFPIRIRLSGELESSLESEWKGKVRIEVKDGTLTVKKDSSEAGK